MYEVININGELVTIKDILSQKESILIAFPNTGTSTVTLYGVDNEVWDFGGPIDLNDLQVGDRLTLLQIVPNPNGR